MKTFRVECLVNGTWQTLYDSLPESEARRIAEFMQRGQPQPGSVRVLLNA